MSRHEKMVVVCQDVIGDIEAERSFAYINSTLFDIQDGWLGIDFNDNDSGQEVLSDYKCNICAKGGLMASWVRRFNKYTIREIRNFSADVTYKYYPEELLEIFGSELLDKIELCFEGSWVIEKPWNQYRDSDARIYSVAFSNISCANERLIAIMQNIIDNKGELVV